MPTFISTLVLGIILIGILLVILSLAFIQGFLFNFGGEYFVWSSISFHVLVARSIFFFSILGSFINEII
jgi:hypothetical protein